jgi:hypothetical protein
MTESPITLACPACGETATTPCCPACSADLSRLLDITAQASLCLDQAREALREQDFDMACCLSARAQTLHSTPAGQRVLDTARIMASVRLQF